MNEGVGFERLISLKLKVWFDHSTPVKKWLADVSSEPFDRPNLREPGRGRLNKRELKQKRRRRLRLRKRHLKSEFALLQTLPRLFQLVQFVKCWQIFLELNSNRLYQSSGKEKEIGCLVFTSSTKREIKHFYVVVVKQRQRNVQKSVMHVQSCCFANLILLRPCRSRCRRRRCCLSALKLYTGTLRPKGATPYPFIYHFWQKRWPFYINSIQKWLPLNITSWSE